MNCLWVNWFLGKFIHVSFIPSEGTEHFTLSQNAQLLLYVVRTQHASTCHPVRASEQLDGVSPPPSEASLSVLSEEPPPGQARTIARQWAQSVASLGSWEKLKGVNCELTLPFPTPNHITQCFRA